MTTQDTPPSKGGPRVRLWDGDFRLLYSNESDDASLADVMKRLETATVTIDDENGRSIKRVHSIAYSEPVTTPPSLALAEYERDNPDV